MKYVSFSQQHTDCYCSVSSHAHHRDTSGTVFIMITPPNNAIMMYLLCPPNMVHLIISYERMAEERLNSNVETWACLYYIFFLLFFTLFYLLQYNLHVGEKQKFLFEFLYVILTYVITFQLKMCIHIFKGSCACQDTYPQVF